MMKMKWQQGVMLSLFAGGFWIGSGGVVGLADDSGKPYALQINYMIRGKDEGMVEVDRLYKTEVLQVKPGDPISGKPELAAYLSSMRPNMTAPESADRPMVWTYTGSRKIANVKLKYVDSQTKVTVVSRMIAGNVTVGGRLNIAAPAGYRLMNPSDVTRIVKARSETWEVLITPKTASVGTAPSNEAEKPGPQPVEEPHQPGNSSQSERPDQSEKPTSPTPTERPQRPGTGSPLPIQPAPVPTPQPSFPVGSPGLATLPVVNALDERPVTAESQPHVSTPPVGNTTPNLDHVSELTEQPVTAIDDESPSTRPTGATKPAKAKRTADSPQFKAGGRRWLVQPTQTSSRRKLPQTNEQTTKGSLWGLVALAGIGASRFWRFRD